MILEIQNMDTNLLNTALKQFKNATKSPEFYLRIQTDKAEKNKKLVKELYDYAKAKENAAGGGGTSHVPATIIVDDMDEEQIWQQLELQNESLWSKCIKQTSKLLSGKDEKFVVNYKLDDEDDSEVDDEEEEEDDDVDGEDDEDDQLYSDDEADEKANVDGKNTRNKKNKFRSSIVDDKFFKLGEMEQFLEVEDKKEMNKHLKKRRDDDEDDEEIDYFNGNFSDEEDDGEEDDEDNEKNPKYSAFFDHDSDIEEDDFSKRRELKNKRLSKNKKEDLGLDESDIDETGANDEVEEQESDVDDEEEEEDDANQKSVKFDLSKNIYKSDSENDDEIEDKIVDDQPKSSFEYREERLRNRISDLEEAAMGEKAWQLKGEISSTSRPQNSLLEEVLEFDSTTRPAPIITEATTLQLEDIIRQRIKDKAWNDVERKFKPTNTPQEFRKQIVLNQEKSKESLAQIYEKEYLKEIDKLDPNAADKVEDEPKEHTEIRNLMKSLFVKLDALSNFYYTPKPAQPEAKIITNLPAISMEEVAPITVSNAQLLAPEEIRARPKGDVLGETERTKTDKKRERRQKKIKQKLVQQRKDKRDEEKQKLGIALSKKEEGKKLLDKVTKSRNVQKMKETGDGKSLKSSKKFFSQLQDEVATSKSKKTKKHKSSTTDGGELSAKRFKL